MHTNLLANEIRNNSKALVRIVKVKVKETLESFSMLTLFSLIQMGVPIQSMIAVIHRLSI